MTKLRALLIRMFAIFRRDQSDADLAAELESHLQFHIEDNLRAGMSPEEARRQALIKLGGLDQTKESVRARRGLPWLDSLLQDTRFALRMLRKNPGFTAVAVLTLALGIGANTAIFSIVQGVLLAPLPYRDPGQLVAVWESNPRFPRVGVSYPNFRDWQRMTKSFQQLSAFAQQGYDLTGPGVPEHFDGEEVSANAFSTLGVHLVLGHEFSSTDDTQGARMWSSSAIGSGTNASRAITLHSENRSP